MDDGDGGTDLDAEIAENPSINRLEEGQGGEEQIEPDEQPDLENLDEEQPLIRPEDDSNRENRIQQEREREDEEIETVSHLSFPPGRVKRIMKLDREIGRVHSEALYLVSLSAELFLSFLAEEAGSAALAKKKKSVRVEHLLSAARNHPPTADFLPDSLSISSKPPPQPVAKPDPKSPKPLPPNSRRIDDFFCKSS
ncbi:nuclear factor Y, subunit C13 [Wolffia australiana]